MHIDPHADARNIGYVIGRIIGVPLAIVVVPFIFIFILFKTLLTKEF